MRAVQGHSVDVELGLDAALPPARLYHGTVSRFLNGILEVGLRPMGRQYVHLSLDVETAAAVGRPAVPRRHRSRGLLRVQPGLRLGRHVLLGAVRALGFRRNAFTYWVFVWAK